jgi:hypothetical protein
MTEEVASG